MEPKLTTFYDLLIDGYTVAQLASTVETTGVFGWDRFGRFKEHKKNSPGAQEALDVLADYFRAEGRFTEGFSQSDRVENSIWLADPYGVDWDISALPIHLFGWPKDKLPKIDRSEVHPSSPSYSQHAAKVENLLLIIGALIDFMGSRQKPYSQSQIIEVLRSRNRSVPGLAVSTLEKWFSAGNATLSEAKRKISP